MTIQFYPTEHSEIWDGKGKGNTIDLKSVKGVFFTQRWKSKMMDVG